MKYNEMIDKIVEEGKASETVNRTIKYVAVKKENFVKKVINKAKKLFK